MSQKEKRCVFVALPKSSPVSEIEMYKLLSEAEIDLSTVTFLVETDDTFDMGENDTLIVLLTDNEVRDPKVAAAALTAARAGSCNIIGVWAPGQSGKGIHPSALKFATAQIEWNAEKLKTEIGSDCAHAFETPDGKTADPSEIEPNECD